MQNKLNSQKKNQKLFLAATLCIVLTIQEVCRHEQLQCDLWSDGELWDFRGAVGVADLVGEVHADLRQHMGRDLPEVHFVGFILSKLTCIGSENES